MQIGCLGLSCLLRYPHVLWDSTIYTFTCMCTLQYYQVANEADAWMNDKAGIAANHDYGRDEDAAVKVLKKHNVICM